MAQNDQNWIPQVIASSPTIQLGIAFGAIGFGVYYARKVWRDFRGSPDIEDANEKTKIALEGLSKLADAQARFIELQQQEREGLLDRTDPGRTKGE